jgi:hypothetical protein
MLAWPIDISELNAFYELAIGSNHAGDRVCRTKESNNRRPKPGCVATTRSYLRLAVCVYLLTIFWNLNSNFSECVWAISPFRGGTEKPNFQRDFGSIRNNKPLVEQPDTNNGSFISCDIARMVNWGSLAVSLSLAWCHARHGRMHALLHGCVARLTRAGA